MLGFKEDNGLMGALCIPSMIILTGIIVFSACCSLGGCVDHRDQLTSEGKYEHVKTAAGKDLYKIQLFCPGKTLTYVAVNGSGRPSSGKNRTDVTEFVDYLTGEEIFTTCPVVEYPILRKRSVPTHSNPQDIDELLKNDVVGMLDKAKTPVDQVPVAESSERKEGKFMLDQQPQPHSQNSITINNYNK